MFSPPIIAVDQIHMGESGKNFLCLYEEMINQWRKHNTENSKFVWNLTSKKTSNLLQKLVSIFRKSTNLIKREILGLTPILATNVNNYRPKGRKNHVCSIVTRCMMWEI